MKILQNTYGMIKWLIDQDDGGVSNETVALKKIASIMKRSISESVIGICTLDMNNSRIKNITGLEFLEHKMVDERKVSNDKIAKFESDLGGMLRYFKTYPSTQGFPVRMEVKIPEISRSMRKALLEMRKATSMTEAKQQKFSFLLQMTQELIIIS